MATRTLKPGFYLVPFLELQGDTEHRHLTGLVIDVPTALDSIALSAMTIAGLEIGKATDDYPNVGFEHTVGKVLTPVGTIIPVSESEQAAIQSNVATSRLRTLLNDKEIMEETERYLRMA